MAEDKKARKLMAEDKTTKAVTKATTKAATKAATKKAGKSPGKWAQFIPMAISAVSSMNKKKE